MVPPLSVRAIVRLGTKPVKPAYRHGLGKRVLLRPGMGSPLLLVSAVSRSGYAARRSRGRPDRRRAVEGARRPSGRSRPSSEAVRDPAEDHPVRCCDVEGL